MSCSEHANARLAGANGAIGRVPRWKRVLDLGCVIGTAPLWVPAGLLLGAIIKAVSPGPILFKQQRIGFGGEPFGCYKFRTMVPNADANVHHEHLMQLMGSDRPMEKLDVAGDSRVIPGGRWVRSLGLDEMAQFINVLRGEMSLVGPRPSMSYETARYRPGDWRRFDVLPGLTGYWQVNGKNRTTFERMIELDLHYVDHASLWLDLKIMALTGPVVIGQVWDMWRKRRRSRAAPSSNGPGANRP